MSQFDQRGQHIARDQYNVAGDINIAPPPVSKTTALEQRDRRIMLDRVERIWITGFLEKSLSKKVQIMLGLQENPDAVMNPWHLVMQELRQPTGALPEATHILQAFDDADSALLILGEPGAGKTTLLLNLLRDLLARAHADETHPLPVLFNLSSWAQRQLPLAEWFIEELNAKYQVPPRLARAWVTERAILPLLDGLDEVAQNSRAACVEAINTYRSNYGLTPLVVCCRRVDYDQLITKTQHKLHLHKAILIQPLTRQQIDEYLSKVGLPLTALSTAMKHKAPLQELASTPLMLSILALAYQHASPEEVIAMQPDRIFTIYTQHMLKRRGSNARYTPEQIRHWLTFLACQMKRHNQTDFYIERMQPDWLSQRQSRRLYRGIVLCLTSGPLMLLFVTLKPLFILGFILFGLLEWLFLLLFSLRFKRLRQWLREGILSLFNDRGGIEIKPAEIMIWSRKNISRSQVPILSLSIFGGLFFVLLFKLFGIQLFWPANELIAISGPVGELSGKFFGELLSGLLSGLLLGIIYLLHLGLQEGVSTGMMKESNFNKPNQGIWLSARNSMVIGLAWALVGLLQGMLLSRQVIGIFFWLPAGLFFGLYSGLFFAIFQGLTHGGLACVQHVVLRLFLWRTGCLPQNLVAFLDEATERILLRKVGGGYVFIHRLLLDYFASLETPSPSQETPLSSEDE